MLWDVVISYMYLSWRLVDCLVTAEFGYESYEEAHSNDIEAANDEPVRYTSQVVVEWFIM